jgi:hypothetical protein
MSIFGNIMNSIFHHGAKAAPPPPPPPQQNASAQPTQAQSPAQTSSTSASTAAPVDVEAVLSQMANQHSGQLNWRASIVDLMKLLNLDSSLQARKELARELNYNGDVNDSAAMNIWLHKQVMKKLAENGGKVPSELLH